MTWSSSKREGTVTDHDALWRAQAKPRIGISTCLLGENVRYDGGHKLDHFLVHTLGKYVEWVPVCPEVECGLPTPREAMRLVGDPQEPRLVTVRSERDLTDRMLQWCRRRVRELEEADLCGFVFKSGSPSSGMQRVKVYDDNGVPQKVGAGLFARQFMEHFPLLPVEGDGRLHDDVLRESFIERIFCLKRYRDGVCQDKGIGNLLAFHAAHKMQLMAHDEQLMRQMGRLVADAKQQEPDEVFSRYERMLIQATSQHATPRTNANVLMHMLGYFREQLSAAEKQEMLQVIENYKGGLLPLIVPVTLMRHYVRKYEEPYLAAQTYLNPHPLELKLRNHA